METFTSSYHQKIGDIAKALDASRPQVLASFIGRELAKGLSKRAIAKSMGKSAPWVTQHAALLDLPTPIAEAVSSGRTADVTLINALLKAYRADPERVTRWLSHIDNEITRDSVRLLRVQTSEATSKRLPECGRPLGYQPVVAVSFKGEKACLLVNRLSSARGLVWVRLDVNGLEIEISANQIKLLKILC